MDDREKLIELIESARYWGSDTSAEIADHLIANGVVIQKEAEWVQKEYTFDIYAECSRCREEYCLSVGWSFADWQKYMRYCPNCYSKMKEVK